MTGPSPQQCRGAGSGRRAPGGVGLDKGAEDERDHEDPVEPGDLRILDQAALERRNPDHDSGEGEDHAAEREPSR